jgi:hypothetical protein
MRINLFFFLIFKQKKIKKNLGHDVNRTHVERVKASRPNR